MMGRLLLIAVLVVTLLLAACGTETTPLPPPAPDATPPVPKVNGSLTVWSASATDGLEAHALATALARFRADNPDAPVELRNLTPEELLIAFPADVASGGGPDVVFGPTDLLGNPLTAGLLLPLDNHFSSADLLDVAVEASRVGGTLHAIPETVAVTVMFFKRDDPPSELVPPSDTAVTPMPDGSGQGVASFARSDFAPKLQIQVYGSNPVPVRTYVTALRGNLALWRPPQSTDVLTKSATLLGIPSDPYFTWGLYNAFGESFIDAASGRCVAFANGLAPGLKYLQDLQIAGARFFESLSDMEAQFTDGELNAIIDDSWNVAYFKRALGDQLRVVPLPRGPRDRPSRALVRVSGWQINRATPNLDAALGLVRYMTYPTIEQIFVDLAGQVPADSRVLVEDPVTQDLRAAAAAGVPSPQVLGVPFGSYLTYLDSAVTRVLAGQGAQQAATEACEEINRQVRPRSLRRVSPAEPAQPAPTGPPATRRFSYQAGSFQDVAASDQMIPRQAALPASADYTSAPLGGFGMLSGHTNPLRYLAQWLVPRLYVSQGIASAGEGYSLADGQVLQSDLHPEDLVVVITTSDAEASDEIAYILDPNIPKGGTHSYRKHKRGFNETVTATQGEIIVTLYRSETLIPPELDVIATAVATISAGSQPTAVPWCLQVVGAGVAGTDNKYKLAGTTGSYTEKDAPRSTQHCP